MLSFIVFNGDAPANESTLRHAHLVGPDNMPVAGEITFEAGRITATKASPDATAIAMQVRLAPIPPATPDASRMDPTSPGVLTLQTCLLPDREQPYFLSLELTRHRIMLFYNKLEEWQLTDLAADHPAMRQFELARTHFMTALATLGGGHADPTRPTPATAAAETAASTALSLAVDASERLALEHARRTLLPRITGATYARAVEAAHAHGRPPARPGANVPSADGVGVALPTAPLIGCAISPGSFTEAAQRVAAETFDFVSMPVRWIEMEPTESKYAFAPTDRWIEWAVRKAKLPVVAGPLIDFRLLRVPDWLYIWEQDYETLRDYVCEHVKNLVTRYRRTITRWTVLSGVHVNSNFHFSFDQMMDLTRVTITLVRKLHPTAKILIEIDQPWGEYYTDNRRSLPPLLYADTIAAQAGVMVDGFGIRVQMGQAEPGQSTRDLMAFSAMLDRYAATDKPISITALGAPSAAPAEIAELASRSPGQWRRPWSEQTQADWTTAVLAIACSKPFVQSVCWQDLYDVPDPVEMPKGGVITVSGEAKPVALRIAEAVRAIRSGTLPASFDPARLLAGAAPRP